MSNRARGLKAKRAGDQFEDIVERSCAYYEQLRLAMIHKTPEPLKPIQPLGKGQFRAVFTKKAQPDFSGTLKGGWAVVMEAKHTATTNIPFDRVAPHQRKHLAQNHALGGLSLVLVSFSNKTFYCVPYQEFEALERRLGKKSCNQKDLADYAVRYKNRVVEFLSELEEEIEDEFS